MNKATTKSDDKWKELERVNSHFEYLAANGLPPIADSLLAPVEIVNSFRLSQEIVETTTN
jgi:hypothetical protein